MTKPSATQNSSDFHSASPEMARFNSALKDAMSISKGDLNRLLEQDKVTPLAPQKRGRKPKASASDRASQLPS